MKMKETDVGRREVAPESEPPVGAGDGDVVELVGGTDRRLLLRCLLLHLQRRLLTCGREGPQGRGTWEERSGNGVEMAPFRPSCSPAAARWPICRWKDRIEIADGSCKMQSRTNICLKHLSISSLPLISRCCREKGEGERAAMALTVERRKGWMERSEKEMRGNSIWFVLCCRRLVGGLRSSLFLSLSFLKKQRSHAREERLTTDGVGQWGR